MTGRGESYEVTATAYKATTGLDVLTASNESVRVEAGGVLPEINAETASWLIEVGAIAAAPRPRAKKEAADGE